jgi:hypothetical protein
VALTRVLPGLAARKIVRLPRPGSRAVHCCRRIPGRATSTSVAVPQPQRGTVTTICAPSGAVTFGARDVSVRVIATHPGRAEHDRPIGESRLSGCAGAVPAAGEQPTAATAIPSAVASLGAACALGLRAGRLVGGRHRARHLAHTCTLVGRACTASGSAAWSTQLVARTPAAAGARTVRESAGHSTSAASAPPPHSPERQHTDKGRTTGTSSRAGARITTA